MTSVTVELFSRKIPIKTPDTEAHIQSLVQLVDQKLDEIDPNRRLPEMTLAILTLLNLADDLTKEKERSLELRTAVEGSTGFLLENLKESEYVC